MRQHLTADEFAAIQQSSLELPRALAVSEHLRSCAECTAAVERTIAGSRIPGLRRNFESDELLHILPDEMTAFVDGTIPSTRATEVESHVAWCERCAQDLDDLRTLARPRRRTRSFRRFLAIAALLAAAFVVLAVVMRQRVPERSTAQRPSPPIESRPAPTHPVARTPAAPDYGRADWTNAVARALRDGQLDVSPTVAALQPPAAPLRGGAATQERAPRILSPAAEVIESRRPEFRWESSKEARYVVTVAARSEAVAKSERLSEPHWVPPRPLARGVTYTWEVEILSGDASVVIPAPPQPPARFHILGEEALREVEDARARFPADHLLLAVVYARHGMISRAEAELKTFIAQERPANAERLLSSLRARSR